MQPDEVIILKIIDGKPSVENGNGQNIYGVSGFTLNVKAPNTTDATIQLQIVDMTMVSHNPGWVVAHPRTGNLLRVKKIEFEDGSVWPPAPTKGRRIIRLKARSK